MKYISWGASRILLVLGTMICAGCASSSLEKSSSPTAVTPSIVTEPVKPISDAPLVATGTKKVVARKVAVPALSVANTGTVQTEIIESNALPSLADSASSERREPQLLEQKVAPTPPGVVATVSVESSSPEVAIPSTNMRDEAIRLDASEVVSGTPVPEADKEISGRMAIEFGTRTSHDSSGKLIDGSPEAASYDKYTVDLDMFGAVNFEGQIFRYPRLITRVTGNEQQKEHLVFGVNIKARDGVKSLSVARMRGRLDISRDGKYDFGVPGKVGPLMSIETLPVGDLKGSSSVFSGTVQGKPDERKGELSTKVSEYFRFFRGAKVAVKATNVDPLSFRNLVLGSGPGEAYPEVRVNGNLDYDYETGNWYTNGISFAYSLGGISTTDIVTGSIKWIEDENRRSNGKGVYQFNLRFNEAKLRPAADESAAFEDAGQDESAFFAIDEDLPAILGSISYVDKFASDGNQDSDDPVVQSSLVNYKLSAHKLSKLQVMNFIKLWLLIVGPVNDE